MSFLLDSSNKKHEHLNNTQKIIFVLFLYLCFLTRSYVPA